MNSARSLSVCLSLSNSTPACSVRRAEYDASPLPAALDGLLHPAATVVQRLTGQPHDVEGIHHGNGVRDFLDRDGLEPGEAVHRDLFHSLPPGLLTVGEPGLEHLLGAALDHVEQPRVRCPHALG